MHGFGAVLRQKADAFASRSMTEIYAQGSTRCMVPGHVLSVLSFWQGYCSVGNGGCMLVMRLKSYTLAKSSRDGQIWVLNAGRCYALQLRNLWIPGEIVHDQKVVVTI